MVTFSTTKTEVQTIAKIVRRAYELDRSIGPMDLDMDLTAIHSNGCPLDFDKLLNADAFDFAHDIRGIQRHIDRATGELRDCFIPRCAR